VMKKIHLLVSMVVLGGFCASNCVAADEKLVKLDIKLPKPLFNGTPATMRGVKLDPVGSGKKRPDFMVSADVKCISQGKPVTGSDKEPIIGTMDQVTDGDKEGTDGSFVEFGPGKQYVQIDLGAPNQISAIVVWHYHSMARVYRDVVVQVADDADFVTNVKTVFNNDTDNSSGLGKGKDYEYIETSEGKLVDAKGVKARYVRLYSNGNTSTEMNHYIEVEVFGRP